MPLVHNVSSDSYLYCTCLSMRRASNVIFDVILLQPFKVDSWENWGPGSSRPCGPDSADYSSGSWFPCRRACLLHWGSLQVHDGALSRLGTYLVLAVARRALSQTWIPRGIIIPSDYCSGFIIKAQPIQILSARFIFLLKDNVAIHFCNLTFMKSF